MRRSNPIKGDELVETSQLQETHEYRETIINGSQEQRRLRRTQEGSSMGLGKRIRPNSTR